MTEKILVVDDEKEILISCRKILEHAGYQVTTVESGEYALELLSTDVYDLMLLDLRLPGRSGLEVLKESRSLSPQTYVIIFTAYATVDSAVEAIKSGAFNYLAKPFSDDQLLLAVEQALEHRSLKIENIHLREQLTERRDFDKILGSCPAMHRVFDLLSKVADSEANILITGKSGTGKELIARTIHANSSRSSGAFVAVDCASLPENLLESELFGHEKGAFTGADRLKHGLLQMAHNGTVFLDEVGDLPLVLQPKLLRTLQERQLRRIGGERLIPINIRVLAATNHDLEREANQGLFRQDLFYRLNVVNIHVPSLHERGQDIPMLAHHFLRQFSEQYRKPVNSFSPEVIKSFLLYSWPGNVREMQNVVERAVLVSNGPCIELEDLPESLVGSSPSGLSWKAVRQREALALEKPFLVDLLRRHQGNVSAAAEEAGMTRKMIYRMARKFGIDIDSFRKA
ncbi:sigma-54 dependent transcriptional regulator [Acidobacteria bacterium AH-259-G07]|nr:sigma-54 dependent transcriptional regulator [Acidobacteria bacterium AH-259-G07]